MLAISALNGTNAYTLFYDMVGKYHPRIGMTGVEDFSQPLYQILEREYKVQVKISREEIGAILSDNFLNEEFELEVAEPILKRKRFDMIAKRSLWSLT